jgi:uncharacterized membrane protein
MTDASQTNLGVAPNVGGLLCYTPCCVGLVFSVVVAIVEKQSRFLRFHALQSLLVHGVALVLGVGLTVAQVILGMIAGPLALLVWGVQVLVGLGFLALTIVLMVKAHANEEYRLPTLGELAQKWV